MLLDAGSDVQVFCLAKPCCLGNMSTRGPSFWGLVRCMSAEQETGCRKAVIAGFHVGQSHEHSDCYACLAAREAPVYCVLWRACLAGDP